MGGPFALITIRLAILFTSKLVRRSVQVSFTLCRTTWDGVDGSSSQWLQSFRVHFIVDHCPHTMNYFITVDVKCCWEAANFTFSMSNWDLKQSIDLLGTGLARKALYLKPIKWFCLLEVPWISPMQPSLGLSSVVTSFVIEWLWSRGVLISTFSSRVWTNGSARRWAYKLMENSTPVFIQNETVKDIDYRL